ncbi:MAG: hypothetical protein M3Z37_10940 [Candidatus Eremiobacteraeota bacterium]|nr:hypothetical protein [Candidatus Eremiobacteraeota bacterium]
MRSTLRWCAVAWLAFACALSCTSRSLAADRLTCPHITQAPTINGDLRQPAWQQAASVKLERNLRDRSVADQATTAYVMCDNDYLYFGFDAQQRTGVQASQHTNDVGQGTDDQVTVYLWPRGQNGFAYTFSSNPLGTHYQFSSENTAYAPTWSSAGRTKADGYSVTMRVPLRVMRGGKEQAWRVQFERQVRATLDDFVWPYDPGEQSPGFVLYAGYLDGVKATVAARSQPRFGLYALDAVRSRTAGGSTSRMGLDASIPITANASIVAALHPDYSNVELDQQTIAPTAFARFFSEVRPFFSQLPGSFNSVSCIGCPGIQELYTPSIPTPRDAYAIEGKQGLLTFGAFDAAGFDRVDAAQSFSYRTKDLKNRFSYQRVAVDGTQVCGPLTGFSSLDCFGVPSVHNDNELYGASHDSNQGLFEYVDYGKNAGNVVTDPSQAQRWDTGIGTYDKDSFFGGSLRALGSQYFPVDGFIQQADLAGYDLNASKTWYRKKTDLLTRVIGYLNVDAYHNSAGQLDLYDTQAAIGLTFQPKFHVRLQTGSDYTRLGDGNFVPINQNGVDLFFNYNTSAPSQLSYYRGRFGPARLDSWTRTTTWRLGPRGSIFLEADNNVQWMDKGAPRNLLWLERASYTYQNGTSSSIALGVRRIIGATPLLEFPSGAMPASFRGCDVAYNPCVNQWNVSGAFYKRLAHDEFYLVYGDASRLVTQPQLIFKVIHYFGAEKGT